MNYKLTVIVALFGKYEKLVNQFGKLAEDIKKLPKEIEVIVVCDNKQWTYAPIYQIVSICNKNVRLVELDNRTDIPAKLYNEGLKYCNGEFVLFYHLCCDNLLDNVKLFMKSSYSSEQLLYIKNSAAINIVGIEPPVENLYSYILSERFISLSDVIIKNSIIKNQRVFNESQILQGEFYRLFYINLASEYTFKLIGEFNHEIYSLENYPFDIKYNFSNDIVDRYINYNTNIIISEKKQINKDKAFLIDLNSEYAIKKLKQNRDILETITEYNKKYKITVLGGYWEHHHNQICFFNYLNRLAGRGFATYKTLFDFSTKVEDIRNSDLVIFSRCRNENIRMLIDYCNEQNIATMYMIDDNWISIAKDYPELYGNMFVEGNPNYDNFIYALKNCSTTLVYNDIIKEDVSNYAKSITSFDISVEKKVFEINNKREKDDDLIYIGFSGSLRWENIAFQALARVANERSDIKIFFVGIISKEQRELFKNIDYIEIPFSNYGNYAINISKLNPDIILAPLTETRTTMSKCYNKYVESGIVSSVCIYSKQKPYTDVIKDGINGFFVENETEQDWYNKIIEVISNVKLLREAQENAYKDIISNYTVDALYQKFAKIIIDVVEGGKFND